MTETVVVLSTADFNAAVWTNKQHLATRLARHLTVIYVESMGLRRPTVSLADLQRIVNRIFNRPQKSSEATADKPVHIVKPHVLPFHGLLTIRKINTRLLHHQMRLLTSAAASPLVLWTFSPVTYGIEQYFGKVVYHSVDLLHTLPHMPTRFMLESERALVQNADAIIASSTGVQRHLQTITHKKIELWENVADTTLYAAAETADRAPRAVFAGNLTAGKVNFHILEQLAATGIDIVLAGPSAIDGTRASAEITNLLERPNVEYVGNLAPEDLANLLNTCTVGLIPYHVNEYTIGVYPMKVYEYLASGLAVVSTNLPSLENVNDEDIHIVTESVFVNKVVASMPISEAQIASRKYRASAHSWESRTAAALQQIQDISHTP